MEAASTPKAARVDLWLDVACLFKTRSEAQRELRAGRVQVNGEACKPNRLVRPGDEIVIRRPLDRDRIVVVLGIAERHVSRAEARLLYEDRTPPPTPEEKERRRIDWLLREAAPAGPETKPDRRERATLRRIKGRS
jgi:ribosome-associated heat shock protein Hsp15